MSYASTVQVKEYLGITSTVVDDNLLEDLIERAEGLIDAYTGRSFESTTATKYFGEDCTDGQDLMLYGEDLLTVTTLTNGDAVEITSGNYRLFPRND
ncbi:MAG: head-tail connector protein, partial [Minisyncoccales bacterium]